MDAATAVLDQSRVSVHRDGCPERWLLSESLTSFWPNHLLSQKEAGLLRRAFPEGGLTSLCTSARNVPDGTKGSTRAWGCLRRPAGCLHVKGRASTPKSTARGSHHRVMLTPPRPQDGTSPQSQALPWQWRHFFVLAKVLIPQHGVINFF